VRRAIFWAFLLLLGSLVLGATVFHDQIANAVASAPVTETNVDANGFIRVHEQGTANVTGTFNLSQAANTVKIDSSANTVALSSVDRDKLDGANTHLSHIENATGKFNFDPDGNLKTSSLPPAPATKHYFPGSLTPQIVTNDGQDHTLMFPSEVNASLIIAEGTDDELEMEFKNGGCQDFSCITLWLHGGSSIFDGGSNDFHLALTQPIPMDRVTFNCGNSSTNCRFNLEVIGS
jgi:hypothetical protein